MKHVYILCTFLVMHCIIHSMEEPQSDIHHLLINRERTTITEHYAPVRELIRVWRMQHTTAHKADTALYVSTSLYSHKYIDELLALSAKHNGEHADTFFGPNGILHLLADTPSTRELPMSATIGKKNYSTTRSFLNHFVYLQRVYPNTPIAKYAALGIAYIATALASPDSKQRYKYELHYQLLHDTLMEVLTYSPLIKPPPLTPQIQKIMLRERAHSYSEGLLFNKNPIIATVHEHNKTLNKSRSLSSLPLPIAHKKTPSIELAEHHCTELEQQLEQKIHDQINTAKNDHVLGSYLTQHLNLYKKATTYPCCEEHKVNTYNNKHTYIPRELARFVIDAQYWKKIVHAIDITLKTPAECGPQRGLWIDYQHIFYPSCIKMNCRKNKIECAGFHHDYLGNIRKSGILQYRNIIENQRGIYSAEWAYGAAPFKSSTFFPDEWTLSCVIKKIIEAYKNMSKPPTLHKGRWIVKGKTKEGIIIEMILDHFNGLPTGKLITAYPVVN